MQTFRRLPSAVLAALLAVALVTSVAGVRTLLHAQDEAAPKPPAAKDAPQPSSESEAKVAKEDPQATELIRAVQARLLERASIQATLRETVFLGDRRTTSDGTYLSGTFPRVRVEYHVRVGGTAGILTEVCDGNVVHTKREIRKIESVKEAKPGEESSASLVLGKMPISGPRYSRCDVQQVAKALEDGDRPLADVIAEAGIGGLPATIASLRRCLIFDTVRETKTKAGTFTVVEGHWNPARLDTLTAAFGPGGAALKQLVPERAALYLDPQTLFPTRIVYLRKFGESEKSYRPILALEFLDPRFDEPVGMEAFMLSLPTGTEEKDETAEYIAAIKPQSAAPPGQGLPAELFPGTQPPPKK